MNEVRSWRGFVRTIYTIKLGMLRYSICIKGSISVLLTPYFTTSFNGFQCLDHLHCRPYVWEVSSVRWMHRGWTVFGKRRKNTGVDGLLLYRQLLSNGRFVFGSVRGSVRQGSGSGESTSRGLVVEVPPGTDGPSEEGDLRPWSEIL